MSDRMEYPSADDYRSGIKVGWRTYKTREEADRCATAAKHNAIIDRAAGYDFGYNMPGTVEATADGRFEVCIP
jgi:hypothetical protein